MPTGTLNESPRNILLTGMFDMKNFGDLMFPLIARERLAHVGIGVIPVSPTGANTGFSDAMASVSLDDMLNGDVPAHGIAIGGGYLIHSHKLPFAEYAGGVDAYVGPGLWLGATLAAAARDVPVAWNAPGAPHPLARVGRALTDAALAAADYVSLRDTGSAELLAAPASIDVHIVPDPVTDIARVWRRRDLEEPFRNFVRRKGGLSGERYVAFHFRDRSVAKLGAEGTAALIRAFGRAHDVCPVLIAVGQTHADDMLARQIASHLGTRHLVLDDPISLAEIAAVIAQSAMYVGASLHGYVAAAAYGVPAILVALPSYRKFQGYLDHIGRGEDLARDWHAAFDMAAGRVGEAHADRIPSRVHSALDRHWARLAGVFSDPAHKRPERLAYLRAWLRAGTQVGGPGWAHLPYARRHAGAADSAQEAGRM